MADPREHGPQTRKANLSPLMVKLGKASLGEIVNVCPFGCPDDKLDQAGYCRHLVGFTDQGIPAEDGKALTNAKGRTMEPFAAPDAQGRRKVIGCQPAFLKSGDILVRITSSYRVYREGGAYPEPADDDGEDALTDDELEEATRPA